jgi:hypothetical protein
VISIILVKDDVTVSVPSVREKKKSVRAGFIQPVCGFDLPAKIFGFDESNPYIFVCNKYGHEPRTRLRAETPTCTKRFGEDRHCGVQARARNLEEICTEIKLSLSLFLPIMKKN